jgi:hypothetical protein
LTGALTGLSTGPMIAVAGVAVVTAIAPYLLLRGATRREYGVADAALYALLIALHAAAGTIEVAVSGRVAASLFVVVKLVLLFSFLLRGERRSESRWSAAAGAAIVFGVSLSLIPMTLDYPVDGDEPFYLLITESIARDGDLDLANQYAGLSASATKRPDLVPQPGDPVGSGGEQYSRHAPFLPILLLPGYLVGGLYGAVATIALFGALLAYSLGRWIEEEVGRAAAVAIFPLVALAPPVLFYSLRIWPEVPAAFFLAEALRQMSRRKGGRFVAALAGLALLKLRFVAIAAPLLIIYLLRGRRSWKLVAAGVAALAVPFVLVWVVTGSPLNVHAPGELRPAAAAAYLRGAFGLLLDGQGGLLFQAPLLFLALFGLLDWKKLPESGRVGIVAAIPYLLLLFPRAEWHGGWSPPLRYLVVFTPLFALLLAVVWERLRAGGLLWIAGVWSAAIVVHGLAYPFRLFHLATGESTFGEYVSGAHAIDFARMIPSYIRPGTAAVVAAAVLLAAVAVAAIARWRGWRVDPALPAMGAALAIAILVAAARVPARSVEFEDAHVEHRGGRVYPEQWTAARFLYSGGWEITPGAEVRFRFRGERGILRYAAVEGTRIAINGRAFDLPPTGDVFGEIAIEFPARRERNILRGESGVAIVDSLRHE